MEAFRHSRSLAERMKGCNLVEGEAPIPSMLTLRYSSAAPAVSVVLPVFNEAATVDEVFAKVRGADASCEVIFVDDGSADGTQPLLKRLSQLPNVHVLHHSVNRGKGAALRLGFARVSGDLVVVQDADSEYDPSDYPKLFEPIVNDEADVVFGSRFLCAAGPSMPWTTRSANRLITFLFNWVYGQRLTDVETCYKVFRREVLQRILPTLAENRFGIEIELAAKVAKIPGVRIVERPIQYQARSRRQGKKIRWTDGLRALWCILKYR
jgi:glycosyltransferase involved in cell wall biosynthesis